jgi:hypothetical protein
MARELVDHAIADLPNECCGMISGEDGLATGVHRAANSEGSPFMYVMDPREQLRIMDDIDGSGEDLLAIYHSHTRSAAPVADGRRAPLLPDTLSPDRVDRDRDAPRSGPSASPGADEGGDLRGARGDR